jgi:hypothetical protein
MDLKKLKLEHFRNIRVVNFPREFDPGIPSKEKDTEVVLYYIGELSDVKKFIRLCVSIPLPKENRTIMVYRKGRKDGVNRDSIFLPFRKDKRFKLKAPMLCSLSDDLSACVMARIV